MLEWFKKHCEAEKLGWPLWRERRREVRSRLPRAGGANEHGEQPDEWANVR